MMLEWIVAGAVSLAVLAFFLGLGRIMEPSDEIDRRIEEWVLSAGRKGGGAAPTSLEDADQLLRRMEENITSRSFGERIKADLAQADLSLTVTEYLFMRSLLVAGGFGLGYLLHRQILTGLLVALLFFFLPVFFVRSRQRARRRKFDSQLPDVLDHLVGSLRAGYGLLQAVEWIGRQLAHPAGTEFERVVREVQLGRSLTDALKSMVRRIESDDLALIITAIQIHHEVGGSLADILETVALTIRERVRIQREIMVLTSQQRYSGYVLMLMPIVLGFVLFLLNPEYEMQLFTPGPTLCIPITTALMMIAGYIAMRRIVDIEI